MGDGGHTGRAATEQALGELYHACYRRLVAQVYAFTTDLSEAQDVVQEAFARALARGDGLAGVDNPEAWLRTVAINVIRRRWRRRRLLDTILLRDRPIVRVVQPGPEPDNADLRAALAAIAPPFREVIVLHYLADMGVDEVAAALGVPAGTVKSRLSRARAALAEQLGDYRTGAGDHKPSADTHKPPPAGGDHSKPPAGGDRTIPPAGDGRKSAGHNGGASTTEVAHA
jgi:RNA polymerase sigma-70 factor (ECF subfamily)